jgi:hypothetical protein
VLEWWMGLLAVPQRHPIGPYYEFRHLQITGKLLRPTGLKTDVVEVSLLPGTDVGPSLPFSGLVVKIAHSC